MNRKAYGFTIVELLIVIVVIGILAAISIVAYNNVQQKARDAQRLQDVKTIAKALEMYYMDHGEFPGHSCGSSCPTPKKSGWSTTADGSWNVLENSLVPRYISALPKDPQASLDGQAAQHGGANYDYARWVSDSCGTTSIRTYTLVYKLENQGQKRDVNGTCSSGALPHDFALASEYAVIKP